jgi:hypothetical protein
VPSPNLALLHRIYADWEGGDFSDTDWADSEITLEFVDGPEPSRWEGVAGMREGWRAFLRTWDGFRAEASEYIELDSERILAFVRFRGRAKASGVALGEMDAKNASLAEFASGRVVRIALYWDRTRALLDVGLDPADFPGTQPG